MATANISTIGRLGMKCFPVAIEVDVSQGLPSFTIVGLPDTIVQESKERIRSAIKNSGAQFPLSRITVNLAPADVKKEGIGFDLPIAIGILAASEQIPFPPKNMFFYGELSLEGRLQRTRGVLSIVRHIPVNSSFFLPERNIAEAALVNFDGKMYGCDSLENLILHLKDERSISLTDTQSFIPDEILSINDFGDIYGQAGAKKAMEISAAGHHNILLSGSPGAGKTLLSRALPTIMPPLTQQEFLEVTEVYSIAGLLNDDRPYVQQRPFRSPHHSASMVSLVGGGSPPRPGEITLAHNGVLFLDEFAELPRSVIEALRQPLEDRIITVTRAGFSAEFPAHTLLVAAINPCPCGFRDDPKRSCTCTPQQIAQYSKKLSGPILDRIDIHVTVPPVDVNDLTKDFKAEPSTSIRKRVIAARKKQINRYQNIGITSNSQLPNKHMKTFCQIDSDAQKLLDKAIDQLHLSARGYHKVLKVARTIADLENTEKITFSAIAEALQYRPSQQ